MGSSLPAPAEEPEATGVCLSYVDAQGCDRYVPLSSARNVQFETARPVRDFLYQPGQRHFAGLWWFATTGEHVGFESWAERDHVLMFDFDPSVVGLASQPFWLYWRPSGRSAGKARRHAPDYFARLADGTGVVIDVRPDDRIELSDAEAFAATAAACEAVGWQYRRVGALVPTLISNVRWPAGYRYPRTTTRLLQTSSATPSPSPHLYKAAWR